MSYHLNFVSQKNEQHKFSRNELDALFQKFPTFLNCESVQNYLVYRFRFENDYDCSVYLGNGLLWAERVENKNLVHLAQLAEYIDSELIGDEGERYLSTGEVVIANTSINESARKYFSNINIYGILFISIITILAFLFS